MNFDAEIPQTNLTFTQIVDMLLSNAEFQGKG